MTDSYTASHQPAGALKSFITRHPIWAFALLAFALSWAVYALPVAFYPNAPWSLVSHIARAGSFGPAAAALIVGGIIDPSISGGDQKKRWMLFGALAIFALGFRWLTQKYWIAPGHEALQFGLLAVSQLLWAWIISGILAQKRGARSVMRGLAERPNPLWVVGVLAAPVVISFAGIWLTQLLGGEVQPYLQHGTFAELFPFALYIFGAMVIDSGANEEPGWRGFMIAKLQAKFSPLIASLIVGFVMGLWHFPLHFMGFYAGSTVFSENAMGLVYRIISSVMLSFGLTYTYNRRGGLLLVILLHAAINGTAIFIASTPITQGLMIALMLALIPIGKMWQKRTPEEDVSES